TTCPVRRRKAATSFRPPISNERTPLADPRATTLRVRRATLLAMGRFQQSVVVAGSATAAVWHARHALAPLFVDLATRGRGHSRRRGWRNHASVSAERG